MVVAAGVGSRRAGRGQEWPAAEGERRSWAELPRPVRDALEEHLHARVLKSRSEPGGFSPGVASRLLLSDGRKVFAKVVGPEPNPSAPEVHRREAEVLAQMPPTAPVPRLLSEYDDGVWIALFLTEVDGRTPRLPWRSGELDRVLHAVERLATILTPSPFAAATFGERHRKAFTLWREMAGSYRDRTDRLENLDSWARGHLDELARLESKFEAASAGSTLLHSDLRADNILLGKDRVYIADWPGACIGAQWVDLLCFLPSVAMQGGPKPWTSFDLSPLASDAEPARVDSVLAALTGFFLGNSRQPPPPGLSTLRSFQLAQGVQALAWLRRRLDGR
ncbi:MAG: aminoglycoside phosphotransferase family protein [Thermoplasmata archaeon]|nr:aminoglycoside phosphotransferase family protein [Thermoplasmata archaeon]